MTTRHKANRLITRRLGEFVQVISSGKVRCLRDLLEHVFKVAAPISCDFLVYEPPPGAMPPPADHLGGTWRGVRERAAKGLEQSGYPEHPIGAYLKRLNREPNADPMPDDQRLEKHLEHRRAFAEPVEMGPEFGKREVFLVAEQIPLNLVDQRLGAICCLVLMNPIHVMSRPDQDKRPERIHPITDLIEAWLAWLYFQRSSLRECCRKMSQGTETAEEPARSIFRSLVCLHTLGDIITFASAGLLLHRGDGSEQRLTQWLEEEVIRFVDPPNPTDECWHNCLQDPWPPCHEGAQADRELAKTLLCFCPWTSAARRECAEVPEGLDGDWQATIRDRLWGWIPRLAVRGCKRYVACQGVDPHSLNAKSLTRLFAAEYLATGVHSAYLAKDAKYISGEERGRCLAHVGRVLHYLLAQTTLDWRTIEGLVWMIAEYGHGYLKIDPRLDIAGHLLHAARTEPALHAMQAYYRDHFIHAIEVCFLGHLLLMTRDRSGRFLWQYAAERLRAARRSGRWPEEAEPGAHDGPSTLEDVLQQWYVAALFHDVGYTIQAFHGLLKMLEFYYHPKEMETFREDLRKSLKSLSDSIRGSDLASMLELEKVDGLGGDHGVIAATHLRSLLQRLGKDKYPGSYYPAIRAIGVHNDRRATVSFDTDPLGFLLILCDTIQEWNRPHLRHATAPSMLLARLLAVDEGQEDTTGPLRSVSLNVTRSERAPEPRPEFQVERGGTLEITLTYGEAIQTNASVFNLWIDSSCNLQRLRLYSLPFDVEVTFKTPWFHFPGRKPQSQMHRLRDAAAETHMHFLRDWLPSSADGTNVTDAVRHSLERLSEDFAYDVLTLDLRRLAEKKTIASDVDRFRDRLRTWKRWSEDRDFEGDYTPLVPGR